MRRTEWEARFNGAGLLTVASRGEALGVHHTTAMRVGRGELAPSNRIIARSLALFGCAFEDLFEIETEDLEDAP